MKTMEQTVIEADRFYTISAATGNVVQAVEGVQNGGNVRLGKYEHKPEQEWAFVRMGDGVYRIRNRANGKLLDLMMTGTTNGTWLHLWEDVSGTSQMWTVEPTREGTVRLRSSWAGGKCMDTVGLGSEAGAILQIWQETPGDDQLWTITEVRDRVKRAAKPAIPAEEKPAVEEAAEVRMEAAAPVEEKPVEVKAETAAPVEEKPVEVKAEAVAPVEEKPVEVKAETVAPVEEKPVEVKVETAAPVEEKPAEEKAAAPAAAQKPAAPAKKAACKRPSRKKSKK